MLPDLLPRLIRNVNMICIATLLLHCLPQPSCYPLAIGTLITIYIDLTIGPHPILPSNTITVQCYSFFIQIMWLWHLS